MEGTRHEKAAIIISAYVIGFVTAFIAFGLSKIDIAPEVIVLERTSNIETQEETGSVHNFLTSVAFADDGLYSVTEEKERILAADRDFLAASVQLRAAEPGYFYDIIDAEASRDGRFIYYCEQLTEEAANCDPYVYALAEDVLYHVQQDGQALYPIVEDHESMWTGDSTLIVNGFVSLDPDRPWELSTVEEVFAQ